MDHIKILKKYLKSRRSFDGESPCFPFVTISRQAGAGGHTLAREIVRAVETALPEESGTGWEVFDHKLCMVIAQDPEMSVSFEELLAERYRSEITQVVEDIVFGTARQYKMFKRIFEIVRGLAAIGKVVIIGRAGNCVTAGLPLGVRVRLVAGMETRITNMMQLLEVKRDAAIRAIKQQDAERTKLIYDYFNKDINDPLNYDAILNADTMDMQEMASIITELIQRRVARCETEPA